jgi:hypothetical protein
MQGTHAPAPIYAPPARKTGPVSKVLQDRRSHRRQRPQGLVSYRDHCVAGGSYGCTAARIEDYRMTGTKSPGAVAAHGASEIDGLGHHVVSEINRQKKLLQASIRADFVGLNRCVAESIGASGCARVLQVRRELAAAGFNPGRPDALGPHLPSASYTRQHQRG